MRLLLGGSNRRVTLQAAFDPDPTSANSVLQVFGSVAKVGKLPTDSSKARAVRPVKSLVINKKIGVKLVGDSGVETVIWDYNSTLALPKPLKLLAENYQLSEKPHYSDGE